MINFANSTKIINYNEFTSCSVWSSGTEGQYYVFLTGALQAIKKIGKSEHIIRSEDFTTCIHTLLWLWYFTHRNFLPFHTQTHLTDLLL
jgi:hypothetical protein